MTFLGHQILRNQKYFWCNNYVCSHRSRVIHPHSKKKGLRNIGHSMSRVLNTKKSFFGNQQYLRFDIWFIMTLSYKMWQILLQNATVIILQNAAKIYCKMRHVFYYKMRQLLQNASILLENATFIKKCVGTNCHYKFQLEKSLFVVSLLIFW